MCKDTAKPYFLQVIQQKKRPIKRKFFKSPHYYHLLGLFLLIPDDLALLEEEFRPRKHPINAPPILNTVFAAFRASLFTLLSKLYAIFFCRLLLGTKIVKNIRIKKRIEKNNVIPP